MFKNYPIEKLTHSQKNHVNNYNNNLINGNTKLVEIKCVICEKNNPVEIFTNDTWGLINKTVYCSSCGMVYTNPRMSEDDQNLFYSSDLYSKIYQPHTSSSSHLIKAEEKVANYKSKLAENKNITGILFLDELTKQIDYKKIKNICEIGSGSGANLIPFIQNGIASYGIELSPTLSKFAKKIGVLDNYKSIEALDMSFDVILMIHSLEHMYDPEKVLKFLRNKINKYLVIEIPGVVNRLTHVVNAHNFYFSPITLQSLLARCGFKCISIHQNNENNFILGIFEPSETFNFIFSKSDEVKKIKRVILKQKFLNMIPVIIKQKINLILNIIFK